MYSISSGAPAQALGAPPWLDSPEYTNWFAGHTEWRRTVTIGGKPTVAVSLPDGVWTPTVGVEAGRVPEPVREPVREVPLSDFVAARGRLAGTPAAPTIQPGNAPVAVAPAQARQMVAAVAQQEAIVAAPLTWPTTVQEWQGFLGSWGLTTDTAVRALALGHYVAQLSGRRLVITSGARTASKQAQLLAAWKKGDPSIKAKPASNSLHLKGMAFDAVYEDGSPPDELVGQVANLLGLRWGASFGDAVHFDMSVVKA